MITLDHPAWVLDPDGRTADRVVRLGTSIWLVQHVDGGGVSMRCLHGDSCRRPRLDHFDPAKLTGPARLTEPLKAAGKIRRLRNPDLWDALANAIIRQVIRAPHARAMYQRFCREHGQPVALGSGDRYLCPDATTVAGMSDSDFAGSGMAFKGSALRNAATAFLNHGEHWSSLSGQQLQVAVQRVPRIGPWTAGAAVADYTNDYSLYPFGDLAVRTWASTLAPQLTLPDTESAFAERWQRLGGHHVADLTALTLAWGTRHAHARS
jgi:DNA-3-methyladenine glycosylase II